MGGEGRVTRSEGEAKMGPPQPAGGAVSLVSSERSSPLSQASASLILVVAMIGLAVYLLIVPPPGFGDNVAHRIALPFVFVAGALGMLENLRTRTHMGQLVGALRQIMGRTGTPAPPAVKAEAVAILLKSLRSDKKTVRETAAAQLKNLTGQDFGEDPAAWESWWSSHKERFLKGQT